MHHRNKRFLLPWLAVVLTIGAAAVVNAAPAVAQAGRSMPAPAQAGTLTLSAALEAAQQANPDLAAASRELEASEGAVIQGRALPNPELAYLMEDTRQSTRTTTLQINQPIELGGKRSARIDAAERGRDIADAELAIRRAEVRSTVTAAFFDAATAQERVRLVQALASLAKQSSEMAAKRVLAGKVSPVEETKARVAESGVRVELAQAQSDLAAARQRLAAAMGETSFHYERVDSSATNLPSLPSIESIRTRLIQSPSLRRAQLEVERRRALAELERAKRIPNVTVSLGVKRDEDLGRNQAVVGLAVPLPLFDSNRGNLLEALRRTDKARDELASIENKLTAEALQAHQRLITARTEVDILTREILPGAESAYAAAVKGFEFGKFSFLDVLDSQRTLFQAKAQHLRALAEAHRAAAEIDRLLGR